TIWCASVRAPPRNSGVNAEAFGWEPALLALPHRGVDSFQIFREARGVEHRLRVAVGDNFRADGGEGVGLARELQRQALVFEWGGCDEFRQADGVQQACR